MNALQRASFKFGVGGGGGAQSPFFLHVPRNRKPALRSSKRYAGDSPPSKNKNAGSKNPLHNTNTKPQNVEEASGKEQPVDIPIQLWYHRLGPVSTFFSWFHRMQLKRPYTVQLCTTLTTYLCGDLLAQDIGGELYDPNRTLRMLTIGAIAAVPGYKWFLFLGRNFNFTSKAASIATKVAVNQAVFTPVFNTYFFGMQAVLTGEGPMGTLTRIRGTVPISIVNSLKLWPAVTAFSFWVIPAQYRFMFSGIFAVAWQCYLSFLNRKEEKIEESTDSLSHPVIPEGG
ncbi:uncharacterized protein A1O9_02584 [Exophiala aquamarina CBS 119918]|uniref:Protein SYM1 n=1 Tax=Exophiala aquamarina CBS 119918 TaxID=1182545 RepID=A0A072PZF8_9EURO|nr:uncharacterized protein A1O9_02584 [Exophiala aquamarina CBS 119918]KEF61020.1 hypothetical protein A1O9_02584 [Exophiala aquamarina CBS 119918]